MTSPGRDRPRVRAVVVNYEGGDLTVDCLRSLIRTDWPVTRLEIVLVDNASQDGVAERVERELPVVRVVRNKTNVGFAAGCNVGIGELDVPYVALVNNDATVEPGWLAPLVDALEADDELGSACPKILLADRFREVQIDSPTVVRGRGDARELGVRVSGARVGDTDVWSRTRLVRGFWGDEPPPTRDKTPGQWTSARATLFVPDVDGVPRVELRLAALRPGTVELRSGPTTTKVEVGRKPRWVEVALEGEPADVVNNVGNELTPTWEGKDRGYLEPDDGRFDAPDDVFAWCGAAVLLRSEYLRDVGTFDEELFLYYEDLELSWRGRGRGWRYRYVPESVVRHVHMASSVDRSELRDHYDQRNRLLVLARHGPRGALRHALGRYLVVTASYARRDMLSRLLRLRVPRGVIVARRLRSLVFALFRLPEMIQKGRRDRKRVGRG